MNYQPDKINDRKHFVERCGELLRIAKPHLISCELVYGKDIFVNEIKKQYERYVPNDEYVVVTCENGYSYKLPVEGNSLIAIANEIFGSMAHK
jgi:hypothetical protein